MLIKIIVKSFRKYLNTNLDLKPENIIVESMFI
jgi:hypothetical protein